MLSLVHIYYDIQRKEKRLVGLMKYCSIEEIFQLLTRQRKWIKMFSEGIPDGKNVFPIGNAKYPSRSSHQRCSIKKLFLKNSQYLQEKTSVGVFFCEYCEIFKNTYFEEHLRTALSAHSTAKTYRTLPNIYDESFWRK